MLKIQRIANGDVVLAVIGQLQADNVGELSALLAEEPPGQALALDLKDLVLVDRQAVGFLQECEAQGIALRNCPSYIRIWMAAGK
jgi:anti-anti-sigma regulatory factor